LYLQLLTFVDVHSEHKSLRILMKPHFYHKGSLWLGHLTTRSCSVILKKSTGEEPVLTSTELLTTVARLQAEGKTRAEIATECGYTTTKEDGSIRILFTDFYTNLLEAKGIDIDDEDDDDNEEETEEEWDYENDDVSKDNIEQYNKLCETYEQGAVDAFVECFSDDELDDFEDNYQGHFRSEGDFVADFYEQMGTEIPTELVVDWEETWNRCFRHDYIFENGYVFRNN
jgi:hypothetical protein